MSLLPCCSQVGLAEVVADEEEWLAGQLGGGIGETVTKVEPGRMTATAKPQEGFSSLPAMRCGEWQDNEIEVF